MSEVTIPPNPTVVLIAPDEANDVTLILEPPQSSTGNFVEFNRRCCDLDEVYLSQPINEADHDSETQFCVDAMGAIHTSFYDHFVPKPSKKKGLAVGCECPVSEQYLSPPVEKDIPTDASAEPLRNPAARRTASGRAPPFDGSTS